MTTKNELLRVVRAKCMWCTCDQPAEIKYCPIIHCPLHPFRMGKDPNPSKRGFAVIPPPNRQAKE